MITTIKYPVLYTFLKVIHILTIKTEKTFKVFKVFLLTLQSKLYE